MQGPSSLPPHPPAVDDFIATTRVPFDGSFRLKDRHTLWKDAPSRDDLKESLEKDRRAIAELQPLLHAEKRRALLVIFQAMDGAGKDSCIAHLLSGVNPQGCTVHGFKTPNAEELAHDHLWRHAKAMPERGMIGVHNRSHYEEVLVVKVHPEYLLAQGLPGIAKVTDVKPAFWDARYAGIKAFESHLAASGITILKFHLHLGKEAQRERFLERIADPDKQWKFNAGDLKERARWKEYMAAYEEALARTSAAHAPWHVIPADDQWQSRALVVRIVRRTLETMAPQLPVPGPAELQALKDSERALRAE